MMKAVTLRSSNTRDCIGLLRLATTPMDNRLCVYPWGCAVPTANVEFCSNPDWLTGKSVVGSAGAAAAATLASSSMPVCFFTVLMPDQVDYINHMRVRVQQQRDEAERLVRNNERTSPYVETLMAAFDHLCKARNAGLLNTMVMHRTRRPGPMVVLTVVYSLDDEGLAAALQDQSRPRVSCKPLMFEIPQGQPSS